jgi:DNA-binding NtrC family response regulator
MPGQRPRARKCHRAVDHHGAGDLINDADLSFLEMPAAVRRWRCTPPVVAPLYEARDEWERHYITTALNTWTAISRGRRDTLGLDRSHLYKKMKKSGHPAPKRGRRL